MTGPDIGSVSDRADTAYDAWQEQRAKIVRALNLPPLVPPQADNATRNVVDEAWDGLHGLYLLFEASRGEPS